MTEGVNSFDSYVLLFSLDFKFVVVLKNTDEACIWNVILHVVRNTHYKFSPHRSNRFSVVYKRYLADCEMSYVIQCYTRIVNLQFCISSYFTKI
jgi:hypothetical protein